ncbi:hypothetical protein GTB64_004466 [Salmonella enterica]|nr:hypothetical protein [Salmonella enterica]
MADPVAVPEAVEGLNLTLGRDYIVPPQIDAQGNATASGKPFVDAFSIQMSEAAKREVSAQPDWNWPAAQVPPYMPDAEYEKHKDGDKPNKPIRLK